jgi:hypothetical protein
VYVLSRRYLFFLPPLSLLPNFLNGRLEEPDFELTKPSTGKDYNDYNGTNNKAKENWGCQLEIQAQVVQSYSLTKKRSGRAEQGSKLQDPQTRPRLQLSTDSSA